LLTLIWLISTAAYHEVMVDCDELTLQANRAQYIAKAQSSDVHDIQKCISVMKQEALTLNAELNDLLKENEIRVQVASLNALPTRDALQSCVHHLFNLYFIPNFLFTGWLCPI